MRNIFLANLALWLSILFIFSTVHLPRDTLFWNSVQNSGHGLVMCFAAFVGMLSIALKTPKSDNLQPLLIVILFFLGTLIEALQHLGGRGANADDLVMNAAGIVAGACFGRCIFFNQPKTVNLLLLLFGILMMAYCLRLPLYFFMSGR